MLWKLEGLSEYDARRPLTPTGTNLLGLVKHLTACELGYFGEVFGRPAAALPPWSIETEMWAAADETSEYITGWYRQAWEHADGTFDALDLDTTGRVPWWGGEDVTLHRVMLHVAVETQRHAGHADIIRELIDGATGLLPGNDNMWPRDQAEWADRWNEIEQAAKTASA